MQKANPILKIVSQLAFLFILVLNSCSKSSDPGIKLCYLTSSTFTSSGSTTTETYTISYDANRRITKLVDVFTGTSPSSTTMTFTYNSAGSVTQIDFSDGFKIVNSYNTSNQRTKREDFDGSTRYSWRSDEYNGTGQQAKTSFYDDANQLQSYMVYSYPNTTTRNYSTVLHYDNNDILTFSEEYLYDDKKVNLPFLGFVGLTDNNPTKFVTKDAAGTVISTSTSVFEYNAQGYPTKITTTYVPTGGATQTSVETDVYDCP